MPEQLLRFSEADWGVVGEGEQAFPALVDALSQGRSPLALPGLAWLAEGRFQSNPPARVECAAGFAVPRLARWLDLNAYKRNMATAPLQSKLGCHFRCVYCTYHKIEGGSYRLMDPADTVTAVREYLAMGFRNIEFVDNVFNSPPAHALAVCEALAAAVVRRHRLPCLWIFMLGGPGETKATVEETLAFAQTALRHTDAAFFTTGIRVYPGTELERIARREGVLSLPPEQMLEPVFYLSPTLDRQWLAARIRRAMQENYNFINGDTFDLPFLPAINRLARLAGIEPPLWRYTRLLRRGLRLAGVAA